MAQFDRPTDIPGAVAPELAGVALPGEPLITEAEVREAASILQKYKQGKANLETRIVDDELWWELRHWEAIRGAGKAGTPHKDYGPEPSSAWLFNSISNKHADLMDNIPEPVVLPREQSDEGSARMLSEILPVVLEHNGYEDTYSAGAWEKLKHGTAAYGVFWDPAKDNGIGDITIKPVDLLHLFWEPGIGNIQDSRNFFVVDLVDNDLLEIQYPDIERRKLKGDTVQIATYLYDDSVDTSEKSVVVDWYYKVQAADGRKVLHYCKFVGDTVLYASENDPRYQQRGYYDHGLYPVVLDCLYPEKGTPVGFGLVAICKSPQMYVDKLSANILETSLLATKTRYFASESLNINESDFRDSSKPIIKVAGDISDNRLREVIRHPLEAIYFNVMEQKIEEMKETSSNRDVNSGGKTGGVTAASAIAALQEAGNKGSRDIIRGSYRAHQEIVNMVIELMRQFYDESRAFRVLAPDGSDYQFIQFSNAGLRDQQIGRDAAGNPLYRRPVFDLKIKAQKKNPFSRMEQNERAKELYQLGFFSPDHAQQSLLALDMMDFEGIDKVRQKVQEGQTLYNMVLQLTQELERLRMAVGLAVPNVSPGGGGAAQTGPQTAQGGNGPNEQIMRAQTPMTGYGDRLARRSSPKVEG